MSLIKNQPEPRAETRMGVALCTAMQYHTALPTWLLLLHNTLFLSLLLSLGCCIYHRFLLILNQIQNIAASSYYRGSDVLRPLNTFKHKVFVFSITSL